METNVGLYAAWMGMINLCIRGEEEKKKEDHPCSDIAIQQAQSGFTHRGISSHA